MPAPTRCRVPAQAGCDDNPDQVIGYVAPKLLGAGKAALLDAGVASIDEAIELDLTDLTQIGPDLRFTASLRPKEES